MSLPPLRFRPLLKSYLWGGTRLATELGKTLPPAGTCAESWELCDRGPEQSVVDAGPLAGRTLAELVRDHGPELLGRHHPQARFPLLFKFLDARQTLSVQVHPDDARAARRNPPDLGKSEAWVVLQADPGAEIFAGLRRGFDRDAYARELHRGVGELCLHRFQPAPGDCVFLPAGAVHALGAGLMIAEIQQSSDVTYRLFDWNRTGADGRPRELHLEAGLEAIDERLGEIGPVRPQPTDRPWAESLVRCPYFVMERWTIASPVELASSDRTAWFLAVIAGAVRLAGDPHESPLTRGATTLVPASFTPLRLEPVAAPATVLAIRLP